ncbi:peptidoglycan bridge formation glycyltransferase FemA/FemB family protein [Algoriphagus sp. A40]|uniref:lipid II:glycine glycyltransferase FemX n=1 Tax=Algoriphagus sp. A40 TaxID=1945863 RepID=UPI000984384E|nr:peptidoglycan bridge formation glycyltransferase FemA/FemB family protein [Algoriphagus sp. A40]OOG74588.1 hypothetical protein B0E43_11345 [Algoriphagus sp. A40]
MMGSSETLPEELGWIITKTPKWLEKWDRIQKSHPLGMFTQTSSWLSSYQAYGFDFELLIKVDKAGEILSGFGNLIVKIGPLKAYVCPWGPFVSESGDLREALDHFLNRAKKLNCFAAQFNLGGYDTPSDIPARMEMIGWKKGNILGKIYSPKSFNIINLPSLEEDYKGILFAHFEGKAKRNIKTGLKFPVEITSAKDENEVRQAYQMFEENAQRESYSIRSWKDIGPSMTDSVLKGNSVVFLAKFENEVVAAIWLAIGGNMFTYIMGGSDKSQKKLNLGFLLQWAAVCKSVEMGFDRYNISTGGSPGVMDFKMSFNPKEIYSPGSFLKIVNPTTFWMFEKGYRIAERNKSLAAKILKLIK